MSKFRMVPQKLMGLSVHDDKNNDAQDSHGDADEETLQEQPEQGSYVHLHQAGFQHRQTNVVDTGVS